MTFTIPMRVLGKNANGRENWHAKARRIRGERAATHGSALVQLGPWYAKEMQALLPCVVTFTMIGPRLRDDDNLQSCCASVRDELAAILCITDGPTDARAEWRYAQRKGDYALEVEIQARQEMAAV